jgi:hypothetical protein
VHGDELLLLADGAEEAERVAAEAQQRDGAERDEAGQRRKQHARALARSARSEHEERQRKPGRQLHAHADHERRGGGTKARTRAGRQQ